MSQSVAGPGAFPSSDSLDAADVLPPQAPGGALQRNASTPGFCCNIEVALDTLKQQQPQPTGDVVRIIDAHKAHDGAGASYIAYVIRHGDRELRRRYSEFHSLRKCMLRLYPTLIVPPIPEKHSLADYATKQTRAKQDPVVIDRRKRMLQTFLNRIAWHPILSTEHIFHRFLEPGILWTDILHSAKVTTLPNTSKPASGGGAAAGAKAALSALSVVGASSQPKYPDPKFVEAEAFTLKFEQHIAGMERTHKRAVKRHADLAADYAELGAAYNAFSLTESPAVAAAIEKMGLAMDTLHASTDRLARLLEEEVGEPLHEYTQFADIIKAVLKYRTDQQVALEQTCESLDTKRTYLALLERQEAEAQRLEEALRREGYTTTSSAAPVPVVEPQPPSQALPQSIPLPSSPPATGGSVRSRGIVGALSDRITAMMDNDPEATRRHNLAKTRDVISLLAEQREKQSNDLVQISAAITQDLDRFQRQKVRDLKRILTQYALVQAEWCRKNLSAWQEAKQEISRVPTHP